MQLPPKNVDLIDLDGNIIIADIVQFYMSRYLATLLIEVVVDIGLDLDSFSTKEELIDAAKIGDLEKVKTLIAAKTNVNAKRIINGTTALMDAIQL